MAKTLSFLRVGLNYDNGRIPRRLLEAKNFWTDTWSPSHLLEDPNLSWYFLMGNTEVVAECTVDFYESQRTGKRYFQIDDVLVNEKFRRLGMCTQLIETVVNHYRMKYRGSAEMIRVICLTEYLPSCRCYEKVLGPGKPFPKNSQGKERRVFSVNL